jgi:hypothetical protein
MDQEGVGGRGVFLSTYISHSIVSENIKPSQKGKKCLKFQYYFICCYVSRLSVAQVTA